MKVVIAIDSFKGSLTTHMAASAVAEGIRRACDDASIKISPLADGGEGTVDAIITAVGGQMREITVTGPLGKPQKATYGIIPKTKTAVIEMSAAAGITLLKKEELNPLYTTTRGVGEMIADAASSGCREFIIGIGGSCTNDGGAGMLSALGAELLDEGGSPIADGAIGLRDLASVRTENMLKDLEACHFSVACDVKNPLCGPEGCSRIFAPQKGADEKMIKDMDSWLASYADLVKAACPSADESFPGAGAAGGLGFAFLSFLGAELKSGVELVMEATGLEELIADADIVVTGEGRLDAQSCMGKAPVGVAALAKKYSKPTVAFAGCVLPDASLCNEYGIDAFFPAVRKPCTVAEAMEPDTAYENLCATAEQAFRLLCIKF